MSAEPSAPLTNERIAQLRAGTPGCADRVHLNTAGAGLLSQRVLDAMTAHLDREARDGQMEAGLAVHDLLEDTRARAAALLNAGPADLAFFSSCTHAWGVACAALPRLRAGQRVLVSRHEWGSNLSTLQRQAARAGAAVEVLPCLPDGSVDAEALPKLLDASVVLVAATWIPANGGVINDLALLARHCRAADVPLLVDAAQAVGQLPVDVEALGCDLLVAPGRKHLRGPRGTALLYVRPGILPRLEPAFLDVQGTWLDENDLPQLRNDARCLETSEMSRAGLLGLREALGLALEIGPEAIAQRTGALAEDLRAALAQIHGVTVRDQGTRRAGLVSFTIDGLGAADVQRRLAAARITVGANGVAYTPLDMRARDLREIVRMSVSYLTTEDELALALAAVRSLAG